MNASSSSCAGFSTTHDQVSLSRSERIGRRSNRRRGISSSLAGAECLSSRARPCRGAFAAAAREGLRRCLAGRQSRGTLGSRGQGAEPRNRGNVWVGAKSAPRAFLARSLAARVTSTASAVAWMSCHGGPIPLLLGREIESAPDAGDLRFVQLPKAPSPAVARFLSVRVV
jgi:hypothetical protein